VKAQRAATPYGKRRNTTQDGAALNQSRDFIGPAWNTYRMQVLPANSSKQQIKDTRRAFYSGAMTLAKLSILSLNAQKNLNPDIMKQLKECEGELLRFFALVDSGQA
jgi:hypothetical protein